MLQFLRDPDRYKKIIELRQNPDFRIGEEVEIFCNDILEWMKKSKNKPLFSTLFWLATIAISLLLMTGLFPQLRLSANTKMNMLFYLIIISVIVTLIIMIDYICFTPYEIKQKHKAIKNHIKSNKNIPPEKRSGLI